MEKESVAAVEAGVPSPIRVRLRMRTLEQLAKASFLGRGTG